MLDIKVDAKKKESEIKCIGTGHEITAELVCVISSIYSIMKQREPGGAEVFRRCISEMLSYPSFIWTDAEKIDTSAASFIQVLMPKSKRDGNEKDEPADNTDK